MQEIYRLSREGTSITLYKKPFWRSLARGRQGYVIDIENEKGAQRHPKFPGHFANFPEIGEYFKKPGENAYRSLAEEFLKCILADIVEEGKTRLLPPDNVYYIDALGKENKETKILLEDVLEKLRKQGEENQITEELLKMAGLENKDFAERIKTAEKEMQEILRKLPYSKELLSLPEEELAALVSVLPSLRPKGSAVPLDKKYHIPGTPHRKPKGYDGFVSLLCKVPYINFVFSYNRPGCINKQPVRVLKDGNSFGDILVCYKSDEAAELLVKTTATTQIQQEFIAAFIRQKIFRKK